RAGTPTGFLGRLGFGAIQLWTFYLGPALTIPLIALPWTLRDRRMRVPLIMAGVFIVALAIETWMLPHYAAPAAALVYLLLVQCMRHLAKWRWKGRPVGRALLRAIPVICCVMVVLRVTAIA